MQHYVDNNVDTAGTWAMTPSLPLTIATKAVSCMQKPDNQLTTPVLPNLLLQHTLLADAGIECRMVQRITAFFSISSCVTDVRGIK